MTREGRVGDREQERQSERERDPQPLTDQERRPSNAEFPYFGIGPHT